MKRRLIFLSLIVMIMIVSCRFSQAYANDRGIWGIGFFVDEFGEKTKQAYIGNKVRIPGEFSNTATERADLHVNFIISSYSTWDYYWIDGEWVKQLNPFDISIVLYEYAGRNPVKTSSTIYYIVKVKDSEGNVHELGATNSSNRVRFNKEDSAIVHYVLMKGGRVQFLIIEKKYSTTKYRFTIENANGYDIVYGEFIKMKEL